MGRGFDLPIWGFMQTIAVMNEKGGSGKSSLALSLSAVLGAAGRRVLLVDADRHRSSLSRFHQLDGKPGLADVLNGQATLEQVLLDEVERARPVNAKRLGVLA